MKIKEKTIVTGGAGFIGSHLVKKLIEKKRKVVVIDDLSSGRLENLFELGIKKSDFEFRKLDLTDYSQAKEGLSDGKVVYHLAARIGGIKFLHGSENSEFLALSQNIAIDSNTFRACLENGIVKIIYASSSAVYPLEKQFKEKAILKECDLKFDLNSKNKYQKIKIFINPDGGYGLAKLLGEVQLNLIKNLKVGIARIFNVYGINEPLDERSHAISDLIKKAILYPKVKFTIWGNGKQKRDYLFVADCVEALIRIENTVEKISPLTLNIGSGKEVAIKEVAKEVIKISGKKIKPIFDLKKPVGPLSREADIKKTENILKWKPKISLSNGLYQTYQWIEKKLK